MDQLLADHIQDKAIGEIAPSIGFLAYRGGAVRKKAIEALQAISKSAKDGEVKASAIYWRAYAIMETPSSDEERKGVLKELTYVIEHGDERTKARASGLRFEMTKLQVGMVAPDIEGKDLDGVAFKLSDYRGKVILLDFWGHW
ncbi:MAG: hypothetical protein AAF517_14545 [Planctomycetota bacterium]